MREGGIKMKKAAQFASRRYKVAGLQNLPLGLRSLSLTPNIGLGKFFCAYTWQILINELTLFT